MSGTAPVTLDGWFVHESALVPRGEAVVYGNKLVVHPLVYIDLKHQDDTDCLAWLTEAITYAVDHAIGPMVSAALQKIEGYSKEES